MGRRKNPSNFSITLGLILFALIFDIITLTSIGPIILFIIVIIVILIIISKIIKVQEKNERIKEELKYESIEMILDKIDYMSGQEFEEYLINYILPINGYYNISGTSYTGDYGVDIIAYQNNIKCAIQCKRANSKITNKAIQEIAAGKKHYKCEKAIVISNNYYTSNAQELAFDNKVLLLDRDDLIKMLKVAKEKNVI